jgi:hypothetical protein
MNDQYIVIDERTLQVYGPFNSYTAAGNYAHTAYEETGDKHLVKLLYNEGIFLG